MWGGRSVQMVDIFVSASMSVILLRVSCVAELSRPDPEMNNDRKGDDVWVELLPVQLVNTH